MTTPRPEGVLELRPVVPRSDAAYREFIGASLAIAVLLGFLLGLHAAVSRLLGAGSPQRTADLIHAHGQAQLLGFAGLYVIGMSLRLLPRFTGGTLQLQGLMPVVLWTAVASLIVRAAFVPLSSGGLHYALLLASAYAAMVSAGCFVLLTGATLCYGARRQDPGGTAFLLAGLLLFVATAVAVFAVIHEGSEGARALPYLTTTAVTQIELFGFIVVAITGVGLRALPTLVARQRPTRGATVLPVGIVVAVAVHAAALLYLEYGAYQDAAVALADATFAAIGGMLLALVWQTGVTRPRANRIRPASQPALWLVRSAMVWLAVAGTLMIYFGCSALLDLQLLGQTEFDAVRHAVGAGVVTSLIVGMSVLILPEFAADRTDSNVQRWLAPLMALLINVAAVLRVLPALAGEAWPADARNLSMAIAGSVAEAGMLLFAAQLLRLMWRQRRSSPVRGA
jgi:hypothetical protein